MGLFDKKYCDVCGEKIGLLGNRKLEDGNLCKNCAKKLSPWFSERRHSTLAEIKEQLEYREENKKAVAAFHTTRSLGMSYAKLLLDEDARKFMVSSSRDPEAENPDVLDFSQVTGCNTDVTENREELKYNDSEGKSVSYDPPRYIYRYDFYLVIHVNSKWFDEMRFKINDDSVEIAMQGGGFFTGTSDQRAFDPAYQQYMKLGDEIRDVLTKVREDVRGEAEAAAAPKSAVTCPWCGATTTPDANGRCEYCGGAIGG